MSRWLRVVAEWFAPLRSRQQSFLLWVLIGAAAIATAGSWAQAQAQPGEPREEQLPAQYRRQAVFYRTNEPPGTIIVDTVYRYLYLVEGNSRAIRYGIGIG